MGKKLQKLLGQAQPHLDQGETIHAAVLGLAESQLFHNNVPRIGTLFATDRRVVLYVKKVGGHELEAVSYGSIGSVETGKTIGGANFKVHSTENSISIRGVVDGDPIALERVIRAQMEHAKAGPVPQAPTAAPSAADELQRLAGLLQQGLITRQQYDVQAQRLLG